MNLQHFSARLDEKHLHTDQEAINQFMEQVVVKKTATQFVPGNPDFWSILIFYESANGIKRNGSHTKEKVVVTKHDPIPESDQEPIIEEPLMEEQEQLLLALRTWRKDKSNETQRPEYLIAHNATLISLAKTKPRHMSDLTSIKGLGPQKVLQYGDDIMAILNAF